MNGRCGTRAFDGNLAGIGPQAYDAVMFYIEFYGVPRLRAGMSRLTVAGASVGEAIDAMALACPSLSGHVFQNGSVHPAYKLSVNGERFVSDRSILLSDGDTLLILSADVGG
jgi:hypothetical protein